MISQSSLHVSLFVLSPETPAYSLYSGRCTICTLFADNIVLIEERKTKLNAKLDLGWKP